MMKSLMVFSLCSVFSLSAFAGAAEKPLFGPQKYDVKERFGKENRYQGNMTVGEGPYVVKLQNGEKPAERPDFIEFSVNGEKLLRENRYEYPVIACFLKLKKENKFELAIKDAKPSGFKRPTPTPRFVMLSVVPPPVKTMTGVFGLISWETVTQYFGVMQKIKNPAAFSQAVAAENLQNEVAARAEAMRKLSDLKEPSAQDFILHVYNDFLDQADMRGEAALALGVLGDKKAVPDLMRGVLDPEDKIRMGAARALSFYPEADTNEQLAKMLERLDSMRKNAVVQTIASAGWKPVGTLLKLAEAPDPAVANTSIELLGDIGDPRAADLLLRLFEKPGPRDLRQVITALGKTKDSRAVEPLFRLASDPVKRRGCEAELGMALADLGDRKSADVIVEMIKKAETRMTRDRLLSAYKKLSGKEFGKETM